MEIDKKVFEKMKNVKSAEELLALAKENGVEMTEESAKAYYELMQVQIKTGELSDEELDNVAGGGCFKSDGRAITTPYSSCEHFCCSECGGGRMPGCDDNYVCTMYQKHTTWGDNAFCKRCKYMSYESELWYCNHPANKF